MELKLARATQLPGSLLKHRLLGATPTVSCSVVGLGPKICMSDQFTGDVDAGACLGTAL